MKPNDFSSIIVLLLLIPLSDTLINSSGIFEYNYLSGQVVHIRGDAGHGLNEAQVNRISDFFSYDCSTSGSLEENPSNISVFPNPASETLSIHGIKTPTSLEIIDTKGRSVFYEKSSKGELNIWGLKAGIYFLHIKKDSRLIVKEFIKE